MPSVDCLSKPPEMAAISNPSSLETFETYHKEDKDSDEESFHLPLDDEEMDKPASDFNEKDETEDDILDKFETSTPVEQIDSQLEEKLLNGDEAEKENKTDLESEKKKEDENIKDEMKEDEDIKNEIKEDEASKDEKKEEDCKDEVKENGYAEEVDLAIKCDVSKVEEKEEESKTEQNELPESASKAEEDDKSMEVDTAEAKNDEETAEITREGDNASDAQTADKEEIVEKCENSNDSTKNQNEDSEDLFDISIIRDVEEDNAQNALNEANAEDPHLENEESEDCDKNTEEEDGNSSDKPENIEVDEVDIDSEEDSNKKPDSDSDQLKNDDGEIEESDSGKISDVGSDAKIAAEVTNDKVSNEVPNVGDSDATVKVNGECRLDEVTGEIVGEAKDKELTEKASENDNVMDVDSKDEIKEERKSLKRDLSDATEDSVAKKPKVDVPEAEEEKPKPPIKTLLSLAEYMRKKKSAKRMGMRDLEEFCIQKVCEAIVHKSEVGELNHQLKLQEQTIESMRKEIQQLTKQARDLEIVNKKLMNDLKQQNATQKPLNPLKITRSVGLQVKFTPIFDSALKRRAVPVAAQKTPVNVNRPRVVTNTPIVKQVNNATPQKSPQQLPKPNTPILSQVLQNRNNIRTPQIRPKPAENKGASVIDLTDEDEKKDNKNKTIVKTSPQKSITVPLRTTPVRVSTPQSIRLTTSQGKNAGITSVVTTSSPQMMYVVQSTNTSTSPLGQKAVLVNLAPNGILTNTLNGSTVSMIPKQGNAIQLKTMIPVKPAQNNGKINKPTNKHPAPLPPPPMVRVNSDKLKPVPPKPHLTIRKTDTGIILQWRMPYELEKYEVIASYQLYAYQETSAMPSTEMWRKVGDVKALALPMACTLTQFADKNKYYFAVRPVDIHKRIGVFSDPEDISL